LRSKAPGCGADGIKGEYMSGARRQNAYGRRRAACEKRSVSLAAVLKRLVRKGSVRIGMLALLLLALTPSAASAFSKAIWGEVYHNGVNQFPIYKQLGVSIYEIAVPWSAVAPQRPRQATNPRDPAYQWPVEVDQAVTQAKRFHMRVLIQLVFTPSWANGGRSREWVPNRVSDFAAFATAAARRYPSVHLWMIWGEPTRAGLFAPLYGASPGAKLNRKQRIAPHNYARLLDAAYGALKRVSRRNTVIGGCTYTTGSIDTEQWIENLKLPNGRPPRMDMYSQNPFTFSAPSFSGGPSPDGAVEFQDLPRLAQWIDRYLRRGMPLFFSEWTVPTQADEEFNYYVDPPVAAKWVHNALHLLRHWKRAYGLGWIHVYDSPPSSYGGLMTVTGKRKPLFYAFKYG